MFANFCVIVIVLLLFLNANLSEKPKFSIYQIQTFEIKNNEGYRKWWYPDGKIRGVQTYSIGYGWNDWGGKRRHQIRKYTRDGIVTESEAYQIVLNELKSMGRLHTDPYKDLAMKLHAYNRGSIKSGRALGGCCGTKYGCGHRNANIRKSHTPRRKMELALWNHDFRYVNQRTIENKENLSIKYASMK